MSMLTFDREKRVPSRFLSIFATLVATFMLAGMPFLDLSGAVARAQAGGDEISLQSNAAARETAPIGTSSVTVLVVAGVVASPILADAIAEAADDSILGRLKRLGGRDHADHLYLPVTIQSTGGASACHGEEAESEFAIDCRLTPESAAEATELGRQIAELKPHTSVS